MCQIQTQTYVHYRLTPNNNCTKHYCPLLTNGEKGTKCIWNTVFVWGFFLFLMSRERFLVVLLAYCLTPRSLNLDGEESLYLKVSLSFLHDRRGAYLHNKTLMKTFPGQLK